MAEPAPILDQNPVRTSLAYATDEGDKYYFEIAAPESEGRNLGSGQRQARSVDLRRARMARADIARRARIRAAEGSAAADRLPGRRLRQAGLLPRPWRKLPRAAPAPRASTSSITPCGTATRKYARRKGSSPPARGVHNDYTHWSARKRVRDLLPDEAETLLSRRFAIVQGVATDWPSDRVGPHHRSRCAHGRRSRLHSGAEAPRPGASEKSGEPFTTRITGSSTTLT